MRSVIRPKALLVMITLVLNLENHLEFRPLSAGTNVPLVFICADVVFPPYLWGGSDFIFSCLI